MKNIKIIIATVLVTVALGSFYLGHQRGANAGYEQALACTDAIEEYCHDVTDSEECEESLSEEEVEKLCPGDRP